MNYYNEIKRELQNNEIYKRVKDYSKNKNDLETYYNVGKIIVEAQGGEERAKYGNGLIKEFSKKLEIELDKKYNERSLRRMRQFYLIFKDENWSQVATNLTWSHYVEVLSLNDKNKIKYYLKTSVKYDLSRNQLREKIKNKEYERLDKNTKLKLVNNEEKQIQDFIKHPILIKGNKNIDEINEEILEQLILEDMDNFLTELGEGFTYIKHQYKIKLGEEYNYIDILLFNYIYNAFVVIELKTRELQKQDIGQTQVYMNYINKNLKTFNQKNTIGIIICKKENKFILEYCSDPSIYETTYMFVNEEIVEYT